MPIYEYKCASCGFQDEFLQKVSERPLKTCPKCGKKSLNKLLSAAGFQLKGSGWYVTDFRGGSKPSAANDAKDDGKAESTGEAKGDAKADAKPAPAADGKADAKPAKKADGKGKSNSKPKAASA
jgi:putative FmdB family regulatory protein